MKRLALLGASGHGKVVADAALLAGWQEIVFFDDAWPRLSNNARWPVAGDLNTLIESHAAFDGIIVAIGNCAIRLQKQTLLQAASANVVSIVHPRATVSSFATLGPGTVVMAGAVINVDAVVGKACIVNTGASVDHDCVLEDGVHVSPGARLSGNVRVGTQSWIGVGACVRQGLNVGCHCMVGAGAVVVKSVADSTTVVGNPARILKRR